MSHGGDRYSHEIMLDFSVNLNPLGVPESVRKSLLDSCALADRYPDLHAGQLRRDLADLFGTDPENVLPGNGASELLMALVHALRPGKAVLPAPAFSGYTHVLRAVDCRICYYDTRPEYGFSPDEGILPMLTPDTDLIILTSPGNPAGRYVEEAVLEKILERCEQQDIAVILDECFMELSDEPEKRSMCRRLEKWPKLLLLRAFTKSFAIPGIRLGYLLSADTQMLEKTAARLPEWNVSLPAQNAGCAAIKEYEGLEQARRMIRKERACLEDALKKLGFQSSPSDTGYLLFRDARNRGINLYQALLEEKILIRDCSDYRGLPGQCYRIAVKKREENDVLLAALERILGRQEEKNRTPESRPECPAAREADSNKTGDEVK